LNNYSSIIKTFMYFYSVIPDGKTFDDTKSQAVFILNSFKEKIKLIDEKVNFILKQEENYKLIDANIFLYTKKVVPWRAMTERKFTNILDDFDNVVDKQSEGLYIDIINNKRAEIITEINTINLFYTKCEDYVEYTHHMESLQNF